MRYASLTIHLLWFGASENVSTVTLYAIVGNFTIHLLWFGASGNVLTVALGDELFRNFFPGAMPPRFSLYEAPGT
ncbi:MAG: hypothetical protein F6K23_01985 [Okeania sp. SIO2C9]|uniref:hypothetical protein n=1 Tax=Okeania sp. SIO2C9 TaxID=2607791 RepID=UPI0013C07768|nr:hypothetical protein [Okeania sp. SIO2C9]NEQ71946.1 hypothetical protein [Okeania sp. SIO2C9]